MRFLARSLVRNLSVIGEAMHKYNERQEGVKPTIGRMVKLQFGSRPWEELSEEEQAVFKNNPLNYAGLHEWVADKEVG